MKQHGHLLLEAMELAAGTEWPPGAPCWCLVRIGRGNGYWLEKGHARELAEGMVLVIPPNHAGSIRSSQLGALPLEHFQFCPELMSGLLSMAERLAFERLAAGAAAQRVQFFLPDQRVAVQFAEVHARPRRPAGLLLRSQLLEIVGLVFGARLRNPREGGSLTLSAHKRLQVLLEHLTEEEFLGGSLEQLADYCGCSPRHFSRLFRQVFKESLRVRQTELRLLKARRLIEESDLRIMNIAVQCGYHHLGVFNTLFKRRFGMTPTEWRRRHAAAPASSPPTPSMSANGQPDFTESSPV
jgi:AraC-like DNA-binding protein